MPFYPERTFADAPFPPGPGYYAVTRHDDVWHASRNAQLFCSGHGSNITDLPQELNEFYGSMINMDDPKHYRLRSIVSKGFTPKHISAVEVTVRQKASELVDRMLTEHPDRSADFVEAFAGPFPLEIICSMMGIPASDNRMIFEFGPDQALLFDLGGGSTFGIAHPVIALVLLGILTSFLLKWTRWGTHVFAIGANERAAVLTGVAVPWVKISVYVFSALMAGITGILEAGWLGGVTTNLGQSMELAVIAAAVIGGANLLGGAGTITGAIVGAALIEIIRNSLILLGISTFWQGAFVGSFIILAVAFDRLRALRSTNL